MVVFFFLIGLEVRQEFAHGSLRDRSRARLALIAGVAGVVLPALVYVLIVGLAGSEGLHGWGAVVGTDTAFMLGTLALVGPRLSRPEERRVGKERVSTCSSRWSTYH